MIFIITEIVCIPTGTSTALEKKKKKQVKSPSKVSRFKPGSDPLFGSDRESRCNELVSKPKFRRFWKSLQLRVYLHSNVLN